MSNPYAPPPESANREARGREEQVSTRNVVNGEVNAPVVQAGAIHGGVHFHEGAHLPRRLPVSLPLMMLRWLGLGGTAAMGLGVYLGASVFGLFALVTGAVFKSGSQWLLALPGLAVFGAVIGCCVALLSRRRFVPRLRYRTATFTGVGVATLPLVGACGQLSGGATAGVFPLIGGCIGTCAWRFSPRLVAMVRCRR